MNNLKRDMPWLYTKRGDTFMFKKVEYIVRMNYMNDIFFIKKDSKNYIFFSSQQAITTDDEIEDMVSLDKFIR